MKSRVLLYKWILCGDISLERLNLAVELDVCSVRSFLNYIFVSGGLRNAEGPLEERGGGLLASVRQSCMFNSTYKTQLPPLQNPDWIALSAVSAVGTIPQYSTTMDAHRRKYDAEALEMLSAEMSFSALYIHDLHRRRLLNPAFDNLYYEDMHARAMWQSPPTPNEDYSPSSPNSDRDNIKHSSTASSEKNVIPTRGRALPAVAEASFKTAGEEEGSETELQELPDNTKKEQPLLLHLDNSSFHATS